MSKNAKGWMIVFSFLAADATAMYLIQLGEAARSGRASDVETAYVDPDPRPPAYLGRVKLGSWIFRRNCAVCHNLEGRGGIPNANYIKDTIPALNTMASRMMITDPEDAKTVVGLLEKGANLEQLSEPPIPRYEPFLAQFKAVRDVIGKGSTPGKKDPKGLDPSAMPSWKDSFSSSEIESVIAYLLTLQPWEEDEEAQDAPSPLDATLVNQDAREFKLSDLRGTPVVVSFIYTHCNVATMCPMAASRLAEVQRKLRDQGIAGVRFLLISFDPDRDRPERLREFAARYEVDLSSFWFATGLPDQVRPLAQALKNNYRQSAPGVFDHQIVVALLDPRGVLKDDFFGAEWSVEEFVEAVRRIVRE